MHKIFISYRREDNQDATGRIYDQLKAQLKGDEVFKDVDSIPYGADFRKQLSDEVGRCDVLLAIVGQRWLDARDEAGKRRLENPADFVRIEIEAALARGIPVIPVLVGNASVPDEGGLPQSLSPFVFRNAAHIRPDPDFHRDMDRLIAALRNMFQDLDRKRADAAQASEPLSRVALAPSGTQESSREARLETSPPNLDAVDANSQVSDSERTTSLHAVQSLSAKHAGEPNVNAGGIARELHREMQGREVIALSQIIRASETSYLDRYKAVSLLSLVLRLPGSKPYLSRGIETLVDYAVLNDYLQAPALEAVALAPVPLHDKWFVLFNLLPLANDALLPKIVNLLTQVTPPAERQSTGAVLVQLLGAAQSYSSVRALCEALQAFNYRTGIPQLIGMVQMSMPEKADVIASVLVRWRVIESAPVIQEAIENGRFGTDRHVASLMRLLYELEGPVSAPYLASVIRDLLPSLHGTIIYELRDVSESTIVEAIAALATTSPDVEARKAAAAYVEKKRIA